MFPVRAQTAGFEVEFDRGIPEGEGLMLDDGAFTLNQC
jgi:hypothetical protein